MFGSYHPRRKKSLFCRVQTESRRTRFRNTRGYRILILVPNHARHGAGGGLKRRAAEHAPISHTFRALIDSPEPSPTAAARGRGADGDVCRGGRPVRAARLAGTLCRHPPVTTRCARTGSERERERDLHLGYRWRRRRLLGWHMPVPWTAHACMARNWTGRTPPHDAKDDSKETARRTMRRTWCP